MITLSFSVWWLLIPYLAVGLVIAKSLSIMWMDIGPNVWWYLVVPPTILLWPVTLVILGLLLMYVMVAGFLFPS